MNEVSKYLGKLCPRGHDFQSTGKSLRYSSSQNCIECSRFTQRKRDGAKERIYPGKNDPKPSGVTIPQGFYLGLLCKRNHDYQKTGFTLRRHLDRSCSQCRSIQATSEDSRQRAREWRKGNPGYQDDYNHQYYQLNRDRLIQAARNYEKTPKGRLVKKASTQARRARFRSAKRIKYSGKDLMQRFEMFDNRCAYCCSTENLTPDHVVPIVKGGIDAIANIVPACVSCNASKQEKNYVTWYKACSFFSLDRLELIATAINDTSLLSREFNF